MSAIEGRLPSHSDLARWSGAALLAGVAHAAVILILLQRSPAAETEGADAAVMLDLAPLSVEAEPANAAQPMVAQAPPETAPDPADKPIEERETPAPDMPPQPADAPPPQEAGLPEAPTETAPPAALPIARDESALALAPPAPRVAPPLAAPMRLTPRVPTTPPRKSPPKPKAMAAPERSPPSPAREPSAAARPSAAAAPSTAAIASWKGALLAHLNRYKRFPANAGTGTASVAFTIARSGQVLSVRLAGSAGDGALDAETVAMVRRASPLPAPPAGFGGATISLSVPVRFSR